MRFHPFLSKRADPLHGVLVAIRELEKGLMFSELPDLTFVDPFTQITSHGVEYQLAGCNVMPSRAWKVATWERLSTAWRKTTSNRWKGWGCL